MVLSFVGLALLFLVVQNLRRGRLQMVHYNDIKSFYPTLLCLVVSSSAVLYGALQQFAPDMWQEFYFHPTLNPFAPIAWPLRIFLLSLWGMAVVGIAAIDDVRKLPGVVDDVAYLVIFGGSVHGALPLLLAQRAHLHRLPLAVGLLDVCPAAAFPFYVGSLSMCALR